MSKAKVQEQLLQDITSMMTDSEAAGDDNKIEDIVDKIRQLNPQKTNEQLRLAACHFMTMYHTRKAMSMGMPDQQAQPQMDPYMMGIQGPNQQAQMQEPSVNVEKIAEFKEAQRKDMELGWNFLDFDDSSNHDNQTLRTARVLKIEIAQRLEDSQRLKKAFDDLMKNQLSQEETLVAFTAAPFLGDWKAMMKLGRKIENYPGGLEQLHMMSLQLPIPDFTLVYELVQEHNLNKKKTQNVNTLIWDLYNVDKIRVKFKNVDCGEFEEKQKELLEEIQKQGEVKWEDVPTTANVHIKRMGGLCQAVSFGEMPMMLNGPWFNDMIHVRGRAEMPLMPEDGQMNPYLQSPEMLTYLCQEEEWFLHQNKENPNLFEGIYTLKQKPLLPPNQQPKPEHAPVNMTFDCEIYLGKSKSNNNINNNNNNNNNDNNDENKEAKNNNDDDDDVMENEDNSQNITGVVTEFDGLTLD